ncbi:hypothetical protein M885DRAFT_542314 [Pelagophyceae sp. CCMP2097]|nr:hypothetical protein M885DRAFT_542314 [Pelagophyceae sp. CCMP2097]
MSDVVDDAEGAISGKLPLGDIDAHDLLDDLPMAPEHQRLAAIAFESDRRSVAHRPNALSPAECDAIIYWASDKVGGKKRDSIDNIRAYEADMPLAALRAIVDVDALIAPTRQLDVYTDAGSACDADFPLAVTAFVRKYDARTERVDLPFHIDNCDASLTVQLSDDFAYSGGEVLLLHNGTLDVAPTSRGTVTYHSATVAHGIRRLTTGARWSLILFGHCSQAKVEERQITLH